MITIAAMIKKEIENGYGDANAQAKVCQDLILKAIAELSGKADILIAVCHMGTNHAMTEEDTSVYELADACPELDVIIAAHEHRLVEGETHNGILIVENGDQAKSMSKITLNLERDGDTWNLTGKQSQAYMIKDYEPDPEIDALVKDYDLQAKQYANSAAGSFIQSEDDMLYGPVLTNTGKTREEILKTQVNVPIAAIEDTAAADLFNQAILYYSGADIAGFPCPSVLPDAASGAILRKHLFRAEPYNNVVTTVILNGTQLKAYMEWAVERYKTMESPDDVIAYDPDVKGHFVDLISGVNYKVNLAKPAGERIEDLEYEGRPVTPEDTFKVAVCGFRANNQLLSETGLFKDEEKPVLVDSQVRGDLGGMVDILFDYIDTARNGKVGYSCDANWELIYEP